MTDEFEVALSFAGEQREYVARVARALEADGIRVFYDESDSERVRLWGLDLVEEFYRIYSAASAVVVMFISEAYAAKSWPTHERRSALSRAINERREYVLPVRFDDTDLPGLPSTRGFLDLATLEPEALAAMVETKLVDLGARLPGANAVSVEWLTEGVNRTPGQLTVILQDAQGAAIDGVRVGAVRTNGTAIFGGTDDSGIVRLPLPARELIDVWVAHSRYVPLLVPRHDPGSDLVITLLPDAGTSGVIFETSTGFIDGIAGRLNPIVQADRYLVYADNISIDGAPARPASFELGAPLAIEDAAGNRRIITFVAAIGDHSLIRVQQA